MPRRDNSTAPRPARRSWLIPAAIGLVALVILVAVWLARELIAERLARQWLAEHRIPAGFQIRSLSLTGLSAKLRVGPADDPDLTVDRVDIGYAVAWPWNGHPLSIQTRSVDFWHPRLKARLAGGKLSFGAVDAVLSELARLPSGPTPDISVEDGTVEVTTPGGVVTVRASGVAPRGALANADARVLPFALNLSGLELRSAGGEARLVRQGEVMLVNVKGGDLSVRNASGTLRLGGIVADGRLPAIADPGRFRGPVQIKATANGLVAGAGANRLAGDLNARLDGVLKVDGDRQSLNGRLLSAFKGSVATAAGLAVRQADASVELTHLAFSREAGVLAAIADGAATVSAMGVRSGDTVVDARTVIRIDEAKASAVNGHLLGTAKLAGALSGHGAVAAATARRLAKTLPGASAEPAWSAAVEQSLVAFQIAAPAWTVRVADGSVALALASPLWIQGRTGARLTMAAGEANLQQGRATGRATVALSGAGLPSLGLQIPRWSATSAGVSADLDLSGHLDTTLASGAAFDVRGRAQTNAAGLRFDLAGCAPISVRRLGADANAISGFGARLCAVNGPLVVAGAGGWRARGRVEGAHGLAPAAGIEVSGAAADFSAAGAANGLSGATAQLAHWRIADTTPTLRFRPVDAAGHLEFAHGAWLGDLTAATPTGVRLVSLRLRQDATGVGRADIATGRLTFSRGGLQPGSISPMADIAKAAKGDATFTGWLAWAAKGISSSGGELAVNDFSFTSPIGSVIGLQTRLRLTSLVPMISAPDQTLTISKIGAVVPLDALAATFDLNADSASVKTVRAGMAQGQVRLEPMTIAFDTKSTRRGVVAFDHVNLGQIIAASNLADALKVDAVVDARLPIEWGPAGLRISEGRLAAVKPGRISIPRKALGAGAGVNAAQGGAAGDLAYQAMENLAFDTLDASLNSVAGDRLRILFHIKGRHDPPQPVRARIAIGDLIAGKAMKKPIPLPSGTQINLTLDSTLNFGELVRELEQAWRDSLGAPAERRRSTPVQNAASISPVR